MQRREVLVGGAALVAASAVSGPSALAQGKPAAHVHGGDNSLVGAAGDCVTNGQACLQHCLMMLGSGDTSMAECSKTVSDMLAVAQALLALSAAGSKHTKALAKLTVDVAKDCEAACRKHQDKHMVCKMCAECCAKLQQEAAKA